MINRCGIQTDSIRRKQLKFGDHIGDKGLECNCLLVKVEGVRASGRSRMKFMDSLLNDIGRLHKDKNEL